MKKDAKVLLTEKWWNDNKAKTLPDKAGLGKALKPIEGAMKLAAVSKGGAKAASIKAASEALAAAEDAFLGSLRLPGWMSKDFRGWGHPLCGAGGRIVTIS